MLKPGLSGDKKQHHTPGLSELTVLNWNLVTINFDRIRSNITYSFKERRWLHRMLHVSR